MTGSLSDMRYLVKFSTTGLPFLVFGGEASSSATTDEMAIGVACG